MSGRGLRPRTVAWLALGGLLLAAVALIDVTRIDPRVTVRWRADISPADRVARERRYELRNGEPMEGTTSGWRYQLHDGSRENIGALVGDAAVEDTGYIDRETLDAGDVETRFSMRPIPYPFSDLFDRPSQLLQLHHSLWLLLAGGVLLWGARASTERRKRNIAVFTLIFLGVMMLALPMKPSFVTMGEALEHVESRSKFERYFSGRVRFEKHLSQITLIQIYGRLDPTDAAPERALIQLSRVASVWFVLSALAIGVLERWSAVLLRYLGLALLAPSTLLYFGWQEFGYLSLNVAAFPLLIRGLRDGGWRLEASSAVAGLGAALHGAGLVSLAGAGIAALAARARLKDRVGYALRVSAWGAAAYLGWIAIYVIVWKLPVAIDPGPAAISPWRPWFVEEVRQGRVSPAIFSATGARDVLLTAWVVGVPLLIVALSLARRYAHEVRTALWYLPPSILFLIFRWPFQGIGGGMDLVFAGFPALYALAWICAHDSKRTTIAAVILMSAHLAFWRIVLDPRFEAVQIDIAR